MLSICALLASRALFVSGALATSVGDGVTLCAKGASVSYPATGTCKSNETTFVLTANGDAQELESGGVVTGSLSQEREEPPPRKVSTTKGGGGISHHVTPVAHEHRI